VRWLMLLVAAGFLHACSDTDAPGDEEKSRVLLELRPYAPSFLEVAPIQTRAFPEDYGYRSYSSLNDLFWSQEDLVDKTIHLLFIKEGNNTYEEGNFYKSGDTWRSTVEMKTDLYHIYGFIPDGVAHGGVTDVAGLNGDYTKGVSFTLSRLTSITPSDVCVTVAAGRGDENGPDDNFAIGKFGFQAQQMADKNFVYLLFDHIYSSVCFSFKVDPEYDKLRTIKLKKLRLTSSDLKREVNAQVTLTANAANPLSVTFTGYGTATADGDEDGELFKEDPTKDIKPIRLYPNTPSDFLGCFVPGNYNAFTLESTYDVYDKNETAEHPDGNLVRKDCVAKNSINLRNLLATGTWQRGVMVKLTLTVNPTYLYMLSEPDLENPAVKVSSGS